MPEQLAKLHLKFSPNECRMFGHWADIHNPEGSLKPGTESFEHSSSSNETAEKFNKSEQGVKKRMKAEIAFNICLVPNGDASIYCNIENSVESRFEAGPIPG